MKQPDKLLGEWFWTDRWMGSRGWMLPIAPRGLYREMLTQAWKLGAALPHDERTIKQLCGVTDEEWSTYWPAVSEFWRVDGTLLVNDTQLEVYAKSVAVFESKRRGGIVRSGRAARVGGRFAPAVVPSSMPTSEQASRNTSALVDPPADWPADTPAGHQPQDPSPFPPPPARDVQGAITGSKADDINGRWNVALSSVLTELQTESRETGETGQDVLADPMVREPGKAAVVNLAGIPANDRGVRLLEVIADKIRGRRAARHADSRVTAPSSIFDMPAAQGRVV